MAVDVGTFQMFFIPSSVCGNPLDFSSFLSVMASALVWQKNVMYSRALECLNKEK